MKLKKFVAIILSIIIAMGSFPVLTLADTSNVKLTSSTVKSLTKQIEDISLFKVPDEYNSGDNLNSMAFYMLIYSKHNYGLTAAQKKIFDKKYKDKYDLYVTQKEVDKTAVKYFGSKTKLKHPFNLNSAYKYDSTLKVYCSNGMGFTNENPRVSPISCTQSGSTYKLTFYFYQMEYLDSKTCFFPEREDKIYSSLKKLKADSKNAQKYVVTFYKKGKTQYIKQIKKV